LTNLARSPATGGATITVIAADGRSLSFPATGGRQPPQGCAATEGALYWDGPDDKGLEAAALGPPPFTYDVVVTLDGATYAARAMWPDDQIPGNEPSVALTFDPPLPALGA
jgi:hypothetical protein